MGSIALSWSAFGGSSYVSLHGTRGSVELGWNQSLCRVEGLLNSDIFVRGGYNKRAAFLGQMQAFAACVRGECYNPMPLQDALSTVEVIEAAYEFAQRAD
jgi:predicted dehydrogenase